jgi:DNA (cytosine-5)-methyltransferase 1
MALGRSPDVAINHDPVALSMHEANHPSAKHLTSSVYAIDPRDLPAPGQRVGLAWFSPDCKHHSKAKGGKPLDANIRDLAWVVIHWAERVRPDVILLENVEEFQDWCPLTPENKPDPDKRGATFRTWVNRLRRLGYKVEWRQLRACDYGAPTIRKRLFVVARRDGRPIVWPDPTHGAPDSEAVLTGKLEPWRTAAEIIDWSLPCPSIFDTSAEIMEKHGLRAVRPLKDATLRRIARGVMRYVIEAQQPFIVSYYGEGRGGLRREHDPSMPLTTVTTGNRHGLVVPTLVQTGYGERPGQQPRVPGLDKPLGTVVAGGGKHALVAAFLAQHNAGARMMNNAGRDARAPLSTLTTRGTQQQVVIAPLVSYGQHGGANRSADAPLHTVTASTKDQNQVIAASMVNMRGTADRQLRGMSIETPVPTVSAGGTHASLVAAFLQKYYGAGTGQTPDDPLHTLGTRDTFGLVTVEIDGETYAIADIGMRMLTPREQFRAQGFPDSYVIDHGADGQPMTKTAQTRMCGNSVCPPVAAALVDANCAHLKGDTA